MTEHASRLFIAGLQRTGTNFAQEIINQNSHRHRAEWVGIWWKHCVEPIPDHVSNQHDIRGVILMIKNPYTWAESICHRFAADIAHAKYNRAWQIKAPGYRKNGINFINLLAMYKKFYQNWLSIDNVILQHYEDLLTDTGRKQMFRNIIDLTGIDDHIYDISAPATVPFSDNPDRPIGSIDNYIKQEAPLLQFWDLYLVNHVLDRDFFDRVGYAQKSYHNYVS